MAGRDGVSLRKDQVRKEAAHCLCAGFSALIRCVCVI